MAQRSMNFVPMQRNFSLNLTSTSSTFSPSKTLKEIKQEKTFKRNFSSNRSLKAIHNEYQNKAPGRDTITKIKILAKNCFDNLNTVQRFKTLQVLPGSILMRQKVKVLVQSLFMDLQIYKKIQYTVKRQKSNLCKLYGWDDKFADIFFSGEEIKTKIDQKTIEKAFFGDKIGKHDSQSRSLYNKMRLFQGQLKQFNTKQQNLNVHIKGKSLQESLDKFAGKLKILQSQQNQKPQIAKRVRQYSPVKHKKSLKQLFGINKGLDDFDLKFNDFDFQQGESLDKLEAILESGYHGLVGRS